MAIQSPSPRTDLNIVLFDANSYYASCHQAIEPALREKPVLVTGDPKNRTGIVLTASYEARLLGVKTTMPIYRALALCPEAILVRPDFSLYLELSDMMWQIVGRYTDQEHIEVVSIDECYADFSGSTRLFGTTISIARRVQSEIWGELHLGVSVGLSYCKIMAKIGSEYARDPITRIKLPRSFTQISPQEVQSMIWPLRVGEIPGVGHKFEQRLNTLGINSIGDLAQYPAPALTAHIGSLAPKLNEWANGHDLRPVRTCSSESPRSLGRSITLSEDIADSEQVRQVLLSLADSVGSKIRKRNSKTKIITLTVKSSDFKVRTFSTTLSEPTDNTTIIYHECCRLFQTKWSQGKPIRLLGISVTLLERKFEQLTLFNEHETTACQLNHTVDTLRQRFGSQIILRGTQLLPLSHKVHKRTDK